MTQIAVWTKWKFIVQSEDEETGEPSATIGQAETREECEALIEYDFDYHRLRGHEIVDAEVCEICAECDGEGLIAAGNDGQVICPACDGHHGPLVRIKVDQAPFRRARLWARVRRPQEAVFQTWQESSSPWQGMGQNQPAPFGATH
jgi:hypothetical protein